MTEPVGSFHYRPINLPNSAATSHSAARIGRIISVVGCKAVAQLEQPSRPPLNTPVSRMEIGSVVKVQTASNAAIGIVSAVHSKDPGPSAFASEFVRAEIILVGEIITHEPPLKNSFRKGVAHFPSIDDPVFSADKDDLTAVYLQPQSTTIDVGTLHHDQTLRANLLADDLFAKHFIIVGATGCGKSSALASILQRVLASHDQAHIVILDIHGEYGTVFGSKAELINSNNLHLPFWLLNLRELCAVMVNPEGDCEAQIEILSDAVLAAKRRYTESQTGRVRRAYDADGLTADAPTPFKLSDVLFYIDEQVGRLERIYSSMPYRRLKARIEMLISDARFGFMFGNTSIEDTMVDVLARLFRIPGDGRPVTVIDVSTVPSEILEAMVSLISRLAFDLAIWSEGALPLLLVCEEAHRYAPANGANKFLPTRDALARIAKEGRKYGISLALISQRPSELDTTILSQCGTVVAMRLSTECDQSVMRANAHDSTYNLLDYLPVLADREAIVLGQGVPIAMHICFDELPDASHLDGRHEGFTSRWREPNMDRQKLEDTIARWRSAGRKRH